MIAAVGPEELGVVGNSCQRFRVDAVGMCLDFFEQTLFSQAVGGELIVNNGIDGDRSLGQPVRQSLLPGRERLKAGRVQLDESRVADALDNDSTGFLLLA